LRIHELARKDEREMAIPDMKEEEVLMLMVRQRGGEKGKEVKRAAPR